MSRMEKGGNWEIKVWGREKHLGRESRKFLPMTVDHSWFGSKVFNTTNKNTRFKSFIYLYFVTQLDTTA